MDKSKQDSAGDSVDDSAPVTARILAMHPEAFSGRENLVQQQKQDMLYQKRTDRPTGPISRLLGKPLLVDDQQGFAKNESANSSKTHRSKGSQQEADLTSTSQVSDGAGRVGSRLESSAPLQADKAAASANKSQLLDANICKPDGHATFEEIFPGKKDDVYKALLERMYPKGIPYRVLANGRKTPWAEVKKTVAESPTQGADFEPQTPTTILSSRG